jgi:hypothetical protein
MEKGDQHKAGSERLLLSSLLSHPFPDPSPSYSILNYYYFVILLFDIYQEYATSH